MKIEKNNIYLESCIEALPHIESNSIDLILTDPPYLISQNSRFSDKGNPKKYGKCKLNFGDWDKEPLELDFLLKEFYRVLKDGGTLIIFYDGWKMQELKDTALLHKFKQPRLNHWQKTNPVPINSKVNYLSNSREYFATFTKKGKPNFKSVYDKGVYTFPICHGKERTSHTTQKPLVLFEQLIEKHSNEGDLILDAFIGSGTTAIASMKQNRNFIGFENDENYFEIARERINDFSK